MVKYILLLSFFVLKSYVSAQCSYPRIYETNREFCSNSLELVIQYSIDGTYNFSSSGTGTFRQLQGLNNVILYVLTEEDKAKGFVNIKLTSSIYPDYYYCNNFDTATYFLSNALTLDAGPSEITTCADTLLQAISNASDDKISWLTGNYHATGKNFQFYPTLEDFEKGYSLVKVTVSNACSSVKDSVKINIKGPSISINSPEFYCADDTISLIATGNYSSIKWNVEGGVFTSVDNISNIKIKSNPSLNGNHHMIINTSFSNLFCKRREYFILYEKEKVTGQIVMQDTSFCNSIAAINLYGYPYSYSPNTWKSTGSGTFQQSEYSSVYLPSYEDRQHGHFKVMLEPVPNECGSIPDTATLYLNNDALANAGRDTIVDCPNFILKGFTKNVNIAGWVGDGRTLFAQYVNPSGSQFDLAYSATSSVIAKGSSQFILEARKDYDGVCPWHYDTITVYYNIPLLSAGNDTTVCAKVEKIHLKGTASDSTKCFWSTSGSGTFSDKNKLETIYTLSPEESNYGPITFTLQDTTNCTISDSKKVNFITNVARAAWFVSVGNTFCKGSTIQIDLIPMEPNIYNLYSSGSGYVSKSKTGSTYTYYPTSSDFEKGKVDVILKSEGTGMCTGSDTLHITLLNQPGPVLSAGPDQIILPGSNVALSGKYSEGTNVYWGTNGTGQFSNSNSLETIYYPSLDDLRKDSIIIRFTNYPFTSCGYYIDTLVLKFNKKNTSTISGIVKLSGKNANLQRGTAVLYKVENQQYNFTQSIYFDSIYSFHNVYAGNYIILALPDSGNLAEQTHFPTYYPSAAKWEDATIIPIISGRDIYLDITLNSINKSDSKWNEGNFYIQGIVHSALPSEANARTTSSNSHPIIYLKDEWGNKLTYTLTSEENYYYFYNLAEGKYIIDGELAGLKLNPQTITLQGDPNIPLIINTTMLPSTLTGVQLQEKISAEVFPNPVKSMLFINLKNMEGLVKIILTRMDGTEILSKILTESQLETSVNMETITEGFYLLKIESENSQGVFKILKL